MSITGISSASIVMITLVIIDIRTAAKVIKRRNAKPEDLDNIFRYAKIVPKIIPFAPNDLLEVKFKEKEAQYGNYLYVIDTAIRPRVAFNDSDDSREDDSLYTLMFVNVDAGDPSNLQWLVTNMVGDGYPTKGQQTVKYEYYRSPIEEHADKPMQRMVFLVYRQPDKTPIDFDIRDILAGGYYRDSFDIQEFLGMYNFSKYPVAGNFFSLVPYSITNIGPFPADWMLPFRDQWIEEDGRTLKPDWE